MPPKSNIRTRANSRREELSTNRESSGEFTEEKEDLTRSFGIADPPYIHNWVRYPSFVRSLIRLTSAPPLHLTEAGSSSQSPPIVLPPLTVPVEQVTAALVASFDALRKFVNSKFEGIQTRFLDTVYTYHELLRLKKEVESNYGYHENLANGVVELKEQVTKLTSEVETAKAERDEAKKVTAAISAQLALAMQSIEALNTAVAQTQQQVEAMAGEIEALGEEPEEEEEDGIGLDDLAANLEEMEVEGHEEVIDP